MHVNQYFQIIIYQMIYLFVTLFSNILKIISSLERARRRREKNFWWTLRDNWRLFWLLNHPRNCLHLFWLPNLVWKALLDSCCHLHVNLGWILDRTSKYENSKTPYLVLCLIYLKCKRRFLNWLLLLLWSLSSNHSDLAGISWNIYGVLKPGFQFQAKYLVLT